MKTINRIITIITIAIFMIIPNIGNAQSMSKIIDLSQIGTNSTVLEYKSGKDRIMAFDISKDKKGLTTILPNFNETQFNNVRVELYNGKELVAEYLDNKKGGPNNNFDNFIFYDNEIPFKTYVNSKEEFWPLVGAVILCCVKAEVSWSEADGWAGSLGFDCDCFGIAASSSNPKVITIKGKEYSITKVKLIPLNQSKNRTSKVGNLSISLN